MKNIYALFLLFSIQTFSQLTCATATTIGAGTYVVNAVDGTDVPTPICTANGTGASKGKWYKYIPTVSQNITITTDLQVNSGGDTRFHIYTGACGTLICAGGDDDGGVIGNGFLSIATIAVTAGTTYTIAFDNRWNSNGFTFVLNEGTYVPPAPTPPTGPVTFSATSLSTANSAYNICVVDMNNDFKDDIVGINTGSVIIHYQTTPGVFNKVDIPTTGINNQPSWSMAAGDLDKNGYNDLVLGGGNGVTFLKANANGTAFTATSGSQYVFSQRSNFVDINNDGKLDVFVCHDVAPNVYYMNDGLGNLTYNQGGLGDHPNGGNYGSVWVDYDNDGDQDLFIAKCRGGSTTANINELHRNNGSGVFTNVSVASNMADPIQTWSSAWADFDNDGDMDAVVGASSTANGTHKYMKNNGNGTFTDATAGSGWDTNTAVNIEHIAYDFDNNGFVDVMGGGNKIMYNNGNGTFSSIATLCTVGGVGDFNEDGFLDIQNGTNLYMSSGNANKWIKVRLQGLQSNRNGIGARIEIYGTWGKQIRDVRSGEGFKFMSTLNTFFGLGTATAITQMIIRWPSGAVDTILNPTVNQALTVVEGSTLANQQFALNQFVLYPNPTNSFLHLTGNDLNDIKNIRIVDLLGKTISTPIIENEAISVQNIEKGTYFLIFENKDGKDVSRKFVKE